MAENLGATCGCSVFQSGFFLIALEAIRIGGHAFEFQGVHRRKFRSVSSKVSGSTRLAIRSLALMVK